MDNIDIKQFKLPKRYALLVPGGAPHRPFKRWPHYRSLATRLVRRGITPVILGTRAERDVIDDIFGACPEAVDLSDKTSLIEIAGLSRKAVAAIGNDTGPMHLIATTGCRSIVLYSSASNPTLCAQRGPHVQIIRKDQLADIEVEEVEGEAEALRLRGEQPLRHVHARHPGRPELQVRVDEARRRRHDARE